MDEFALAFELGATAGFRFAQIYGGKEIIRASGDDASDDAHRQSEAAKIGRQNNVAMVTRLSRISEMGDKIEDWENGSMDVDSSEKRVRGSRDEMQGGRFDDFLDLLDRQCIGRIPETEEEKMTHAPYPSTSSLKRLTRSRSSSARTVSS
jgi:hypothetical protein